jgi:hypothetical protein
MFGADTTTLSLLAALDDFPVVAGPDFGGASSDSSSDSTLMMAEDFFCRNIEVD